MPLLQPLGYFESEIFPATIKRKTYEVPSSADHDLVKHIATCLTNELAIDKSRILVFSNSEKYATSTETCLAGRAEPMPILRSQHLGCRITCALCGARLGHAAEQPLPSPFIGYHKAALEEEPLLDEEAMCGVRTWASPTEIARLLSDAT